MDIQILHAPDHINLSWGGLQIHTHVCNTFDESCVRRYTNDEIEGIHGGRVPCDLSQQQLKRDAL